MFALFAFVFLIVLFVFSWLQKNRPMGHYAWPLCFGKHWPLGKSSSENVPKSRTQWWHPQPSTWARHWGQGARWGRGREKFQKNSWKIEKFSGVHCSVLAATSAGQKDRNFLSCFQIEGKKAIPSMYDNPPPTGPLGRRNSLLKVKYSKIRLFSTRPPSGGNKKNGP